MKKNKDFFSQVNKAISSFFTTMMCVRKDVGKKADEQIKQALHKFDVVEHDEFDSLARRVRSLEKSKPGLAK
jgi:BMFP domain-containing protein YqiC